MMRRKHGTGSITPRNGRYLARLHVRGRLRALGTFDTHDEAERVLSAAAAKLASPDYVAVGGSTLREIGQRCLDRRELDGLRDVPTDRSRFKCHIAETWLGTMPVKTIAGRDVRQWLDELARKDAADRRGRRKISRETRKHCLNLVRACLEQAVDDGLIETNPATGIKLREQGKQAVEAVRRWLELLPTYAKENPLRLAFPTPRGCRRDRGKVYGFHKLRANAGITRRVRWHDLRHTCASSLVAGWWGRAWRLEEIREVLGHSSIEVTQRYAHLASSVVQEAANATRIARVPQTRSNRDPRGSNSTQRLGRAPRSGAVGRRFESSRARKEESRGRLER